MFVSKATTTFYEHCSGPSTLALAMLVSALSCTRNKVSKPQLAGL